jgi:hypothetical protein
MPTIDPRVKPNLWLSATICDLIDQGTEESLAAAKEATSAISQWLEPGLIDDLFRQWIEDYMNLMESRQSH